jgi:hypothetical protein
VVVPAARTEPRRRVRVGRAHRTGQRQNATAPSRRDSAVATDKDGRARANEAGRRAPVTGRSIGVRRHARFVLGHLGGEVALGANVILAKLRRSGGCAPRRRWPARTSMRRGRRA